MILDKPVVVLDFEATGTWVDKDRIIEIGMIKCLPDGTEVEFCKKVNPKMKIPEVVTEITGISDADVVMAPYFEDLVDEVLEFISDSDLGGFNIDRFDLPLLNREVEDSGRTLDMDDRFIYDAQKIYHIHERRDLTSAYSFFCNDDLENAHTAMADTRATLDILKAQIKKYGKHKGLDSLREFNYTKSSEFFDDSRKFRWWDGELHITFGKHSGKNIKLIVDSDSGYLDWILNNDFSEQVKSMIRGALNGNYPAGD